MAEFDSEIVRAKKRKIEEDNFEGPLLSPPSQENLLPDSQLSESQAVASDVFDLTLVEPVENEKCDNEFVWEKIELQSVTAMLKKFDRNLYEVPESFSAKFNKKGIYQGYVKCSHEKCESFISRELNSKKNLNIWSLKMSTSSPETTLTKGRK